LMDDTVKPVLPWWVLLLCGTIGFASVFHHDLWTPDEPRVAAISLEMSRTGNVVVPRLAGEPFVEKPPMYFAVSAFLIRTVGVVTGNTAALRLAPVLWGLGVLAMTFLLTRRLFDRNTALLAAALLATMAGFVENSRWIRADIALMFFVAAAVWCLAEVFFAGRRWFCVPAGLFAAGAFLSKGIIGPGFIGIAWLGMLVPHVIRARGRGELRSFLAPHMVGLCAFLVLSGTWAALLRVVGGRELWDAWFWENQFGRFLGTSKHGHMRGGEYFFYLSALAMYAFPWVPAVTVWAWRAARDIRTRALSRSNLFLLVWSAGTLLLLTVSTAKREVYMLPLLPVFAIMCAETLGKGVPRWCGGFFTFWQGLCLLLLAVFTTFPLCARFLPDSVPAEAIDYLKAFSFLNVLAGCGLAFCIALMFGRPGTSGMARPAAITAVFFIGLAMVPLQAIDRFKSMEHDIRAFVSRVPPERRPAIAGWHFSETMRGCFYYYGDWSVPQIEDEEKLAGILKGENDRFDSVIISEIRSVDDLVKAPYRVLLEGYPGAADRVRPIVWIEGVHERTTDREE